jgi:hypothetical protein
MSDKTGFGSTESSEVGVFVLAEYSTVLFWIEIAFRVGSPDFDPVGSLIFPVVDMLR